MKKIIYLYFFILFVIFIFLLVKMIKTIKFNNNIYKYNAKILKQNCNNKLLNFISKQDYKCNLTIQFITNENKLITKDIDFYTKNINDIILYNVNKNIDIYYNKKEDNIIINNPNKTIIYIIFTLIILFLLFILLIVFKDNNILLSLLYLDFIIDLIKYI